MLSLEQASYAVLNIYVNSQTIDSEGRNGAHSHKLMDVPCGTLTRLSLISLLNINHLEGIEI
jgi:hypothetical protein